MIASIQPSPTDAARILGSTLYVDTHVHLYRRYNIVKFLDAAVRNVKRNGGGIGVLCLTERNGEDMLGQLREQGEAGPWQFNENGEPFTLLAEREGEVKLILLAGRQIVTSDRLEVLALVTPEVFTDGLDTDDTVVKVLGSGAVTVLPWGFGKWSGQRGKVVATMIERYADQGLMLGDNAGRPPLGPRPALFDAGATKKMGLLPGTDPLPIASGEKRPGSYGVVLEGRFTAGGVGQEVRQALKEVGPVPHRYGHRTTLLGFMQQQATLRFQKPS